MSATERDALLGGDAEAQSGAKTTSAYILGNLLSGTAPAAQIGVVVLIIAVASGLKNIGLVLFTAHPALNLVGIAFLVQAILVLQPTRGASEKRVGAVSHSLFHLVGISAFAASFALILVNKGSSDFSSHGPHFKSAHGIFGFATYCFMAAVAAVGFTQYYTPALYGGVDNAKAVWKYHRSFGYVALVLVTTTVTLASETGFNLNAIHIPLWTLALSTGLILLGVLPGLSAQKLGLKSH